MSEVDCDLACATSAVLKNPSQKKCHFTANVSFSLWVHFGLASHAVRHAFLWGRNA